MANLLATNQLNVGDVLCIDSEGQSGRLVFQKQEVLAVPVPVPELWQQPTHTQVAWAV
jgi:hypothetical protein